MRAPNKLHSLAVGICLSFASVGASIGASVGASANETNPITAKQPRKDLKPFFVGLGANIGLANLSSFLTTMGETPASLSSSGIAAELGYRISPDISSSMHYAQFGFVNKSQGNEEILNVRGHILTLGADVLVLDLRPFSIKGGGGAGASLASVENAASSKPTTVTTTKNIPTAVFFGKLGFEYFFEFGGSTSKSSFAKTSKPVNSGTDLSVRLDAGYRIMNVTSVPYASGANSADLSLSGLFFAIGLFYHF